MATTTGEEAAKGAATLTGDKKRGPLGPKLGFWQSAFCGSLAGVLARIVVAPFDVVKIRLQLQSEGKLRSGALTGGKAHGIKYTSVLQSARLIVLEEGITGLWKGNLPAEYLYLTYGAVQFLTYQQTANLWRYLDETYPNLAPPRGARAFVGGATAGMTATLATYPFDLLRTRFAAQGQQKIYSGICQAVRVIYKEEGIRGMYRGLAPSILQIMPYMGLVFGSYDWMRKGFAWSRNQSWWRPSLDTAFGPASSAREELISGAIAGTLSKVAVYPIDTVRKRTQVQGPTCSSYAVQNIPRYSKGMVATFTKILQQEGIRGLYNGLSPAIMKAAPASAVTLMVYNRSAVILKQLGLADA